MDVAKEHKHIFELSILLITVSIVLLLSGFITFSYAQAPVTTTPSQEDLPEVKITSIEDGDSVPILGNLTISGTSSDDAGSACQVSVIANDVRPYQPTIATGSGGPNDFSEWKFTIASNYTSIKQGVNEITSKVVCPGTAGNLTKWYGVNVTGVGSTTSLNANSSEQGSESATSSQSNGPVYSYSKQQNANNNTSGSGNTGTQDVKVEATQSENKPTGNELTAKSANTSNNSAGVTTNFVPPFSP
jgi:hypothetical protein